MKKRKSIQKNKKLENYKNNTIIAKNYKVANINPDIDGKN